MEDANKSYNKEKEKKGCIGHHTYEEGGGAHDKDEAWLRRFYTDVCVCVSGGKQ